jgi:hypothetical protein
MVHVAVVDRKAIWCLIVEVTHSFRLTWLQIEGSYKSFLRFD